MSYWNYFPSNRDSFTDTKYPNKDSGTPRKELSFSSRYLTGARLHDKLTFNLLVSNGSLIFTGYYS